MNSRFAKIFGNTQARGVLLSSMLTMSAIGIIYIWSVFVIPLETYFNWPRNQLTMVFTVTMVGLSTGLAFGGFVHMRLTRQQHIGVSAVLLAVSFAVTSFTDSLAVMVIFYGAVCGLVMGILYSRIIYVCNLWYSREITGTVSGILQTSLAAGTVTISYATAGLLEVFDWRTVFRIIGVVFTCVMLVAYKYIKLPPPAPASVASSAGAAESGLDWREMLRTRTFWLFFTIRVFLLSGGVGMVGHAVPVALELGVSYQNAILALGFLSFCNGAGRALIGMFWDFAGVRKTLLLDAAIFVCAFTLLLLAPVHQNQYLMLLGFCMCGFAYGGINLIGISFTRAVFGLKHFARNYGFGSLPMIPSSFLGPYIMSELKLSFDSYHYAFLLFVVTGCLAIALLGLMKKVRY